MYPDFNIQTATIAGTSTQTSAWMCTTLDLAIQEHDRDGDNVTIDGEDDAIARETIRLQRTESFDFDLNGRYDPDGEPYPSMIAGLAANKRLFVAAFYNPALFDDDGQVEMEFVDADDTELAGMVQPLRCRFSRGLESCTAVLTLRFPEPLEVVAGS